MEVGIITYDTGHKKTWQLLQKLMFNGYRPAIFAFPFKLRPPTKGEEPRFKDRPSQLVSLDMREFCTRNGLRFVQMPGWESEHAHLLASAKTGAEIVYITTIAKIIPASFIEGRTILNCHPGLLPYNRGVDSFKRGIVNLWPIGITLHVIDPEIDRGTVLQCLRIPVLPTDSLADICQRSYDAEVDLTANFDRFLKNRVHRWTVGDSYECMHKEIPIEQDRTINAFFIEHRQDFMRLSVDSSVHPPFTEVS